MIIINNLNYPWKSSLVLRKNTANERKVAKCKNRKKGESLWEDNARN